MLIFFFFLIVVEAIFQFFQGLVVLGLKLAVVLCGKFAIVLHSHASHGAGTFEFSLHNVT